MSSNHLFELCYLNLLVHTKTAFHLLVGTRRLPRLSTTSLFHFGELLLTYYSLLKEICLKWGLAVPQKTTVKKKKSVVAINSTNVNAQLSNVKLRASSPYR